MKNKLVLFALLGALGCAFGAVLGDVVLPRAAGVVSPVVAPTLFSQDLQRRLDEVGARTGDVRVSLRWYNHNDLDLVCVDPFGEEVYFLQRRTASGGELDVDRNARPPYDDEPVENIYWPLGQAPAGTYRVYVHYYRNRGAPDPTRYLVGWTVGPKSAEVNGEFTSDNIDQRVQVSQFDVQQPLWPMPRFDWATALVVGGRTALLGLGLALALVISQNLYLRRPLFGRGTILAGVGGLLVGLGAGSLAQLLFRLAGPVELGVSWSRLVAWLVLGGLLGWGMTWFVPNLPVRRAALSGALGGLVGALAFELLGRFLGERLALALGAGTLGASIGLMVALVEVFFRQAWLEIHFGPGEMRTVSLGADPVCLGSGPACTVYIPQAPEVGLVYTLEQGRILCASGMGGTGTEVSPGDDRKLGSARVLVRGLAREPDSAARSSFALELKSGPTLTLTRGIQLRTTDLPGLDAAGGDNIVAEVVPHPKDPNRLGLKNLSTWTWSVTQPDGSSRQIDNGRSVQLQAGAAIYFGPLQGQIR